MKNSDATAIAINAAGIADSLRMCQIADHDGAARIDYLTEQLQGWFGVMIQVVSAAEAMERFRVSHGTGAKWGGDLPYLYEVWDAIAAAMWDKLGTATVDNIVSDAIEIVICESLA